MKYTKVLKEAKEMYHKVKIANTFFGRLKGLVGYKRFQDFDAMLISPCQQVHTFGMRYPIDVIFLSEKGQVLSIEDNIPPGKISAYRKNAVYALEIEAKEAEEKQIKVGDILTFETCTTERERTYEGRKKSN